MKQWMGILLLTLILAGGCSRNADERIEATVRAFHAAFDAKNVAAMTALCAEDMFWYTLNGKALNRNQINDYFDPMLARWQEVKTELSGLELRREGGLAVVRYKSLIRIVSSGKPSTMQNCYTTVLVRKSGAWKIWQHHMTTQ